jgi:hypothetical protein
VVKAVVTLHRFIIEEERRHPEATGDFTSILYDIAFAATLISRAVNKAGLIDILGATGDENVHGERVQKLDEYANKVIFDSLDHGGHLCLMASEESEQPIPIPEQFPKGDYVLLYDPLDGSSNIDANVSIGTIFSVHRRRDMQAGDGALSDLLQPGVDQVAAGYVLYGSSTMLVYTTGAGVHGFTLDNSIGAFLLSHPRIEIPDPGKRIYSVNEAEDGREVLASLHRIPGSRLSPHVAVRRALHVPGRRRVTQREAAASVRGLAALHGVRTGGWCGYGWAEPDTGCRAERAARAGPVLHGQQGVRGARQQVP